MEYSSKERVKFYLINLNWEEDGIVRKLGKLCFDSEKLN